MNRKPEPLLYQIRAEKEDADEAEILIYDHIGADWFGEGVTSKGIIAELNDLEASTVRVRINSGGGDVFEGNAIQNALRRHPANVVVHIDSLAASAASVIAMAGDEIRMADNAFMMIHKAWGMVVGNANDMLDFAETLEKVDDSLVGVYASRTGRERDEVAEWMSAETWFSAEEAVEVKLADAIDTPPKAQAKADLSLFAKVPPELAARMADAETPEPDHGPDPEIIRVAASAQRTLSRTRL